MRVDGPGGRLKWIGAVTSAVAWTALAVEVLVWNDAATAARENAHLSPQDGDPQKHLDPYATAVAAASTLGPATYLIGRVLERRTGR